MLPLQTGVVLTGVGFPPGAQLLPVHRSQAHRLEFYGDSITEDVMALCPVLGVDCADGTKDYALLVGGAFDTVWLRHSVQSLRIQARVAHDRRLRPAVRSPGLALRFAAMRSVLVDPGDSPGVSVLDPPTGVRGRAG